MARELGRIAASVRDTVTAKASLQERFERFARVLGVAIVAVSAGIFGVGVALHNEALEMLMVAMTRRNAAALPAETRTLLRVGLLCTESALVRGPERWEAHGDPTETALIVAALKGGLDPAAERFAHPLASLRPAPVGPVADGPVRGSIRLPSQRPNSAARLSLTRGRSSSFSPARAARDGRQGPLQEVGGDHPAARPDHAGHAEGEVADAAPDVERRHPRPHPGREQPLGRVQQASHRVVEAVGEPPEADVLFHGHDMSAVCESRPG